MKPNFPNQQGICPVIVGTGLVALDIVISNNLNVDTQFYTGGSCGNVLTILSYLGWNTYPIARLSNNVAADLIAKDLSRWKVKDDLITYLCDGSTPIIIHRILKDKTGAVKHRFEFRNPEDGTYLPSYKPCLAKDVEKIIEKSPNPNVFYFDRINRASINLAKEYQSKGAIIVFEPSSMKDEKGFKECLSFVDIVKFSNDRIPQYSKVFSTAQAPLEIQTLGEKGLLYRQKNNRKWSSISAFRIKDTVDTAGAGDWCTAGIIFQLQNISREHFFSLENKQLIEAFKFGQFLSAINCTYEGARGLMYTVNRSNLLKSAHNFLKTEVMEIPKTDIYIPKTKPLKTKLPVTISSLVNTSQTC